MLILARNIGEKIRIAEDIVIEVVSLSCGQVKLGISAPLATIVLREELVASSKHESQKEILMKS